VTHSWPYSDFRTHADNEQSAFHRATFLSLFRCRVESKRPQHPAPANATFGEPFYPINFALTPSVETRQHRPAPKLFRRLPRRAPKPAFRRVTVSERLARTSEKII
jgi:hypothetical protein